MDNLEWSEETYRLEEIPRAKSFPCIVKVTEGFLSETEAEGLLDGDIIKINTAVHIQNVIAEIISDVSPDILLKHFQTERSELAEGEWFIPLHNKGNFKIIQDTRHYESVKELFKDFPRYAKLCNRLKIAKNDGQERELPVDTVIELDRMFNRNTEVEHLDMLVFSYKLGGKNEFGLVSLKSEGHFISEQDNNEYTLMEIIERYKLPQLVTFIDKGSKDRKPSGGVMDVGKITATIQLNRLVSRRTLIGQYIQMRHAAKRDVSDSQKSLLLLPLDNQMSRRIQVKVAVCGGEALQNISDDESAASGSRLYEDLVINQCPGGFHTYQDLQKNCPVTLREGVTKACEDTRSSRSFQSGWKSKFKKAMNLNMIKRKYSVNDKQKNNVEKTGSSFKEKPPGPSVYEDVEIVQSVNNNKVLTVPNIQGSRQRTISRENQPEKSEDLRTGKQKPFLDLKVDELADRLAACGFNAMAKICKEEHLDGGFFAYDDIDFLRKSPFNLGPLEMLKFAKIKNGWTP